jgi:probable phosphoglycerate mutase
MRLYLARHGNTFEAGEKALWVGARTDLPLTAKGKQQALALARALGPKSDHIKMIVAGPLMRTREHAEIVSRAWGGDHSVSIDGRLKEIDYGLWEGKSSEEIGERFGENELAAWNAFGIWPKSAGWKPLAEEIARDIMQLAAELSAAAAPDQAALLVSSNGILKFFLKLVPGAFEDMAEKKALKVATGNYCALEKAASGWKLLFWDRNPAG